MIKVLLIDDDDSTRQFSALVLENLFPELELLQAATARKATKEFDKHQDISLIVTRDDLGLGGGEIIYNHVVSKEAKVTFICYGPKERNLLTGYKFDEEIVSFNYTKYPIEASEFEKLIRLTMPVGTIPEKKEPAPTGASGGEAAAGSVEAPIMESVGDEGQDQHYSKVRIAYFWRFNKTECDIYIRLSQRKYVKVVHAGDIYDRELIDRYIKKKQKYLYIQKVHFEQFAGKLANSSFLSIASADIASGAPEEKVESELKTTHAIMADLVQTVGITKGAIELAGNYSSQIFKIAQGDSQTSNFYNRLRSKKDYIYDHSYMLSCVCAFICKEMDWNNEQTIDKLCLASLFHDITLEDPALAICHTEADARDAKFSDPEVEVFLNHPIKAAEMVKESKDFPIGTDQIIYHHHETPSGDGFPGKLSSSAISPIICIFIIAHDFVAELFAHQFDENSHGKIMSELEQKFSTGNYKQVFQSFKKVFEGKSLAEISGKK